MRLSGWPAAATHYTDRDGAPETTLPAARGVPGRLLLTLMSHVPVELFAIQCTTCKARLMVKDESVIGDILACPKCHSMVHVVPPVGWQRPGTQAPREMPLADDTVPVQEALKKTTPLQRTTPLKPRPAQPTPPKAKDPNTASSSSSSKVKVAAAAAPPALPLRPRPPAPATPAAVTAAAVTPAAATESIPSAPAPATVAAAAAGLGLWARLHQDMVLWIGGLAGGALLGACVWLVLSWQATDVSVAEAPPEQPAPVVNEPVSHAAEEPAPERPAPPPAIADNKPAGEAEVVVVEPAVSREQPEPAPAVEQPAPNPAEPAPAQALEPRPALKLEPAPAGTPAPANPPASAVDAPAETSDKPNRDEPAADQPAESPGEPAPLADIEIERRMSMSLERVAFTKVTLAQFVEFVAEASGVPVAIDEAGLKRAGKSRKSTVTISLRKTTAAEALRAALDPLDLRCEVRDGRVIVTGR